jgi:hypothetical protein
MHKSSIKSYEGKTYNKYGLKYGKISDGAVKEINKIFDPIYNVLEGSESLEVINNILSDATNVDYNDGNMYIYEVMIREGMKAYDSQDTSDLPVKVSPTDKSDLNDFIRGISGYLIGDILSLATNSARDRGLSEIEADDIKRVLEYDAELPDFFDFFKNPRTKLKKSKKIHPTKLKKSKKIHPTKHDTKEDLDSLTVKQLRERAKNEGKIEYSRLRKDELIFFLRSGKKSPVKKSPSKKSPSKKSPVKKSPSKKSPSKKSPSKKSPSKKSPSKKSPSKKSPSKKSTVKKKELTVVQLRALCKEKEIRGYSKLNKDDLIKKCK